MGVMSILQMASPELVGDCLRAPWLSNLPHACRYAAHFLAVNGVAVLTSVLALARPPFQVIRYALAALEAVTRVCGPAGCDVSPALAWHILHLRERLPFSGLCHPACMHTGLQYTSTDGQYSVATEAVTM